MEYMSTDRGDPSMSAQVFRPGTQPSASRLEQTDRLVRNVYGIGQTRVSYRNNRIGIAGGGQSDAEWSVAIDSANHVATIYHRPVVSASRRIPAAWATDEDVDYTPAVYYALHAALSVDLLDEDDEGLGSGFISVEIDLDADTLTGIHTVERPVDDPPQSIVRWPLVHITETKTTIDGVTTYRWSIDNVLHTGQIKIPALFAP
jgi:thioredoxin reductase